MAANALDQALSGIKVLDMSRVLAGPFCGQHLADLGADVVKLEEPRRGDETRAWGPPFAGDLSAYFLSCNRGKRALALDLAASRGRVLLAGLVRRADIVLENFRPDSAAKLGVSARERFAGVDAGLEVLQVGDELVFRRLAVAPADVRDVVVDELRDRAFRVIVLQRRSHDARRSAAVVVRGRRPVSPGDGLA